MIRHLTETARTFIFDTGLAPAAVGAALAALRLLRAEPHRADRAREVARSLAARLTAAGLQACEPDAAVVSVRAPARRPPSAGPPTASGPGSPSGASARPPSRTGCPGCG